MFFEKGLKDAALIHKLGMKNPMMSEVMLAIANKYALAEEVILDNSEAKLDKKPCHPDQPRTSKANDKKRKNDCSITNVEWPRYNRTEYWPILDGYKSFLDGIYILHTQGKHKTWDCNRLQGFTYEVLKSTKKAKQEKKSMEEEAEAYTLVGHGGRTCHPQVPKVVQGTHYL
jgi:hypothetical protein